MNRLITSLVGCFFFVTATQAQTPGPLPKKSGAATSAPTKADIVGVWSFVGNVGQAPSGEKKIKIIQDGQYMFSQYHPESQITLYNHGGSFLLDGNQYVETMEYGGQSIAGLIKQTFRYTVKIEGDTMTLMGPWNEIWKRVN